MTYQFIIAEEVAEWMSQQHISKVTFEDLISGLTSLGRETAETALEALKVKHDLWDVSYTTMVELQGWHKVEHTLLYSAPSETLESMIETAVNAVTPIGEEEGNAVNKSP